jgi:hypothetical protein
MKSYKVIVLTMLLGACSSAESNKNLIELTEQNISIEIPIGWSFDADQLNDASGKKKGEWTLGVVESNPHIDCKEFSQRLMNEGKDMITDKGSYSFYKADGGDVSSENHQLTVIKISGKKIYRITADLTEYYEDENTGESKVNKGIQCQYCMELSQKKMALFSYYPDSKKEINLADSIISSIQLLK